MPFIPQPVRASGAWWRKLVALWGSDELARDAGYALHVSLVTSIGMLCLTLPLGPGASGLSRYQRSLPRANRMQRAAADLLGLHATAQTIIANGYAMVPGQIACTH